MTDTNVQVVPGSVWKPDPKGRYGDRYGEYRYEIIDGKVEPNGLLLALFRKSASAAPERVYVRHADLGTTFRRVDLPEVPRV